MNEMYKSIITHPGERPIANVILASGEDCQSRDDAPMECNNLDIDEAV